MTFYEWLEEYFYKGFDPSSLSDREYYELEDVWRYEMRQRKLEAKEVKGDAKNKF